MPDLDIRQLAYLLHSRHGHEASEALAEVAEGLGLGPQMARELQDGIDPAGLDEAALEQAFKKLQWLAAGRNGSAPRLLAEFATAVSSLAVQLGAARDVGAVLLALRRDGRPVIENPVVREHIGDVLLMLDQMGAAYIHEPSTWEHLIGNAFKDFAIIDMLIRSVDLKEWENPYGPYKAMVLRANERVMHARASKWADRETKKELERLSVEINQVFEDCLFHEVLQKSLEIWARSIEAQGAFEYHREILGERHASAKAAAAPSCANCEGGAETHDHSCAEGLQGPDCVSSAEAIFPVEDDAPANSGQATMGDASVIGSCLLVGIFPSRPY